MGHGTPCAARAPALHSHWLVTGQWELGGGWGGAYRQEPRRVDCASPPGSRTCWPLPGHSAVCSAGTDGKPVSASQLHHSLGVAEGKPVPESPALSPLLQPIPLMPGSTPEPSPSAQSSLPHPEPLISGPTPEPTPPFRFRALTPSQTPTSCPSPVKVTESGGEQATEGGGM